jgi:hypothetical protein
MSVAQKKWAVVVAAVAAILALAGSAGAETWRYPDGSFENVGGKKWVQQLQNADTADPFVEVHRTADYVELYDGRRLLYVRLYAGAAYWRHTTGPNWTKGAGGYWEDGPFAILPVMFGD